METPEERVREMAERCAHCSGPKILCAYGAEAMIKEAVKAKEDEIKGEMLRAFIPGIRKGGER